jgi:hypothetical protein
MLKAAILVLLISTGWAEARCDGCSCRGGPGFRAADGKCVGWKELKRKCGDPPEARCTDERDGKRRDKAEKDDEAAD